MDLSGEVDDLNVLTDYPEDVRQTVIRVLENVLNGEQVEFSWKDEDFVMNNEGDYILLEKVNGGVAVRFSFSVVEKNLRTGSSSRSSIARGLIATLNRVVDGTIVEFVEMIKMIKRQNNDRARAIANGEYSYLDNPQTERPIKLQVDAVILGSPRIFYTTAPHLVLQALGTGGLGPQA